MPSARRKHLDVEMVGDVAVVTMLNPKILDEQTIRTIGDKLFALVESQEEVAA